MVQRAFGQRSDSTARERMKTYVTYVIYGIITLFRQLKIAFKKILLLFVIWDYMKKNTETIGKIYFLVRQNLEAENKHKILLVFFFTYRYC